MKVVMYAGASALDVTDRWASTHRVVAAAKRVWEEAKDHLGHTEGEPCPFCDLRDALTAWELSA